MPSYRRSAPLCAALLLSCIGDAGADCYILKDRSGQTLSRGNSPPFSLSWPRVSPEHQASQKRDEHLIILSTSDCREVAATSTRASIEAANTSGYVPDNKAALEGLAARYQGLQLKLEPGEFWGPTGGGSGRGGGSGSGTGGEAVPGTKTFMSTDIGGTRPAAGRLGSIHTCAAGRVGNTDITYHNALAIAREIRRARALARCG